MQKDAVEADPDALTGNRHANADLPSGDADPAGSLVPVPWRNRRFESAGARRRSSVGRSARVVRTLSVAASRSAESPVTPERADQQAPRMIRYVMWPGSPLVGRGDPALPRGDRLVDVGYHTGALKTHPQQQGQVAPTDGGRDA
ncbi:hypothetical protein ACWD5Z_31920 [Micromonospora chokoriensis]